MKLGLRDKTSVKLVLETNGAIAFCGLWEEVLTLKKKKKKSSE